MKLKKPKAKARTKAWNFSECQNYIEEKYKIDIRDYSNQHIQFDEWCDLKKYGEKDPEGKNRGSSKIWFAEYQKEISDGVIIERPYQDFWHFICDTVWEGKGVEFWLDEEFAKEAWQKEILDLFIKEFGHGPYIAD